MGGYRVKQYYFPALFPLLPAPGTWSQPLTKSCRNVSDLVSRIEYNAWHRDIFRGFRSFVYDTTLFSDKSYPDPLPSPTHHPKICKYERNDSRAPTNLAKHDLTSCLGS